MVDTSASVPQDAVALASRTARRGRRDLLTTYVAPVAVVAVLGAFVVSTRVVGLPTERLAITLWCLLLVVAAGLGQTWQALLSRTAGWVAVYFAFLVYDFGRGIADALGRPVDFTGPMRLDEVVTGVIPTVWLQQHVYADGYSHWFHVPMAVLYMAHFFAAYAVMIVLQVRRPQRFWPFVAAWITTTYISLVVFMLHPSAPPWMAARDGYMAPVQQTALYGLGDLNLHAAARLVDLGRVQLNQVAAFPSLHAAYPALIMFFFWAGSRWWTRAIMLAYTVGMGLTLILGAEHWLVDVLAGWFVAFVAVVLVRNAPAWWRQRTAPTLP